MAELIAFDAGPFHVFKKLRNSMKGWPVLQELLTCYYCQSLQWAIISSAWCWHYDMVDTNLLPWFAAAVGGLAVVIFRVAPSRRAR